MLYLFIVSILSIICLCYIVYTLCNEILRSFPDIIRVSLLYVLAGTAGTYSFSEIIQTNYGLRATPRAEVLLMCPSFNVLVDYLQTVDKAGGAKIPDTDPTLQAVFKYCKVGKNRSSFKIEDFVTKGDDPKDYTDAVLLYVKDNLIEDDAFNGYWWVPADAYKVTRRWF